MNYVKKEKYLNFKEAIDFFKNMDIFSFDDSCSFGRKYIFDLNQTNFFIILALDNFNFDLSGSNYHVEWWSIDDKIQFADEVSLDFVIENSPPEIVEKLLFILDLI